MPRMEPLAVGAVPEIAERLKLFETTLGFIPNSVRIMQRRPKIAAGLAAMNAAVMDPEGEVELGFKRLIGHLASRAAGCRYCMAHTIHGAERWGIPAEKLDAVWEYGTSPLFNEAERAALDFALAAGSQPNAVTDAQFADLRRHWTDGQIVEILGVVSFFGFLNRWNDSLATPLEETPTAAGEKFLARGGWSAGKHG